MTPPRRTFDTPSPQTLLQRMELLRERAAGSAVASDATSTGEGDRAVLADRARALAQPDSPPLPTDAFAVVCVRMGREQYGFEAAHVLEVVALAELAPLPGAQLPVFAVTAWRGELLLLLDIRRALGLSATALNDLRHVVVLEGPGSPVGILVDEVLGMTTLGSSEVRELGSRRGAAREFVRGVTSDALIVLETSALWRMSE
ncbi:MAG TPA: chemotaxis protein CheW [Gemmatimonadaceae bacterium]|nr:chemotaxis protein CheW [Gemmatimonadaceae bacterium]